MKTSVRRLARASLTSLGGLIALSALTSLGGLTSLGRLSFGGAHAEPYAMFWSGGHTWVIDAGEGTLYRAPHLYATGPGGVLFEYALVEHSVPSQGGALAQEDTNTGERPYGGLYRWVSFERFMVGDTGAPRSEGSTGEGAQRLSTPLTSHFRPEQVEGDFSDEHQLLQFTGERVTLSRVVSQRLITSKGASRAARKVSRSLYTIDLANRKALPQITEAPHLEALTRSLFPSLVPSCLQATSSLVQWELPGQRLTSWLLFTPPSTSPALEPTQSCPSSGALRLRAPTSGRLSAGALRWLPESEQLIDLQEPLMGGVVDALLHPSGDIALVLEGKSRAREEGLFVTAPISFEQPALSRALSVWRRRGSPRLVTLPPLLELKRLDGARWLPNHHPLLQLLKTHFMSLEGEGCFQRVKSARVERYHRPPPPALSAHLCRVSSQGRLWGGTDDLSAQLTAAQDQQRLYVDVWVHDPTRARGDSVSFWFGDPERPVELKVTQSEVLGAQGLADQVLARWREGPETPSSPSPPAQTNGRGAPLFVEESVSNSAPVGGYLVSVELPLELVKGRLSVAVSDVDPSSSSAKVTLWVAGEPKSGFEAPTPAPLEVE